MNRKQEIELFTSRHYNCNSKTSKYKETVYGLLDIKVRRLEHADLDEADRILRLAFGTFVGLDDPMTFLGDSDFVRTRFTANPDSAFAIEVNGKLVGSSFVTYWGSVGFLGPISIHPNHWNKGLSKHLMQLLFEKISQPQIRYAGLFTFAHSPKHIHLYQKFNFWPRFLTAIMSKSIQSENSQNSQMKFPPLTPVTNVIKYSEISSEIKTIVIEDCRHLTSSIFPGLDLEKEILSVFNQKLGETILTYDSPGNKLTGFAICHCGKGTEAGSEICYVKFGAVSPRSKAQSDFIKLIESIENMALDKGLTKIIAGCNIERNEAYRTLINYGFRTEIQGVSMHLDNKRGYNQEQTFIIDDWR